MFRKIVITAAATALALGAMVAPASAISDAIVCDEYHNGGGMNADCANHIFFMMEVGQLGDL